MAIDFPVAGTSDVVSGDLDTELLVPAPSGIQNGDLLFAFGRCVTSRSITPPAGWTQIATVIGMAKTYTWFKKASSESGDYVFAVSGSYSIAAVAMLRIAGAVCESVSDFTATTGGNSTNDQTSDCPDIETSETNCVVLWCEAAGSSVQTASSCSRANAVERIDTPANHMSIWSELIASVGTVTGAVITRTGFGVNTTQSVAIKTAAAGGGTAIPVFLASYRRRRY